MLINADAFAGRVALVTGASRGIGAAVAKKLTEAGAFVVGTATSEKGAEAVSAALGEKGRGIVLNVTDRAACAEAVNAVVTEFGRIDILVNNAGITRDMLAMRLSDEDWDALFAIDAAALSAEDTDVFLARMGTKVPSAVRRQHEEFRSRL